MSDAAGAMHTLDSEVSSFLARFGHEPDEAQLEACQVRTVRDLQGLTVADLKEIVSSLPIRRKIVDAVHELVARERSQSSVDSAESVLEGRRESSVKEEPVWLRIARHTDPELYSELRRCMFGIDDAGLKMLKPEDLVSAVYPLFRPRAAVLIRDKLRERMATDEVDPFTSILAKRGRVAKSLAEVAEDRGLFLGGRLISCTYEALAGAAKTPPTVCSSVKHLKTWQPLENSAETAATSATWTIDLSRCGLMDQDAEDVNELVHVLDGLRPRSVSFAIDLSCNRIRFDKQSCTDALLRLLKMESVRSVLVADNPFAESVGGRSFVTGSSPSLDKLIWIPRRWLYGTGWRQMLSEIPDASERIPAVERIHGEFYRELAYRE